MYKKILELMNKKGITTYQLAKATKITTGNFSDWKNGRSKPSIKALKKIADFFEVPIEYFFEEQGNINITNFGNNAEINGIKNLSFSSSDSFDENKEKYIYQWNALNEEGREKILEYGNFLLGKYKK